MPTQPLNPAGPPNWVDASGGLTISARSIVEALIRAFNFMVQSGVAGPTTVTLFGPTTNGSLTIQNGQITNVVAPT